MSKPSLKLQPGDEVRLRFWDHMEDADEPMECFAWGRIHKVTRWYVTLDAWAPAKTEDREETHNALKTFAILRKCITEVVRLPKPSE